MKHIDHRTKNLNSWLSTFRSEAEVERNAKDQEVNQNTEQMLECPFFNLECFKIRKIKTIHLLFII